MKFVKDTNFPFTRALGVPVYDTGESVYVRAADLERALAPLVSLASAAERERAKRGFSEFPNPYPHHAHSRPGIWDDDNGELAGKPCAACAAFTFLDRFIVRDTAESLLQELVKEIGRYQSEMDHFGGTSPIEQTLVDRARKLLERGE